ncbi:hypothetical protein E4U55_007893 [Claviceps digitariae]|nr:hypothetical protein E4U55_007893 [Claviceps digitariae]
MAVVIPAPDPARLLAPMLPVLPVAAACPQPTTHILPLLSPILRQRVQLLSSSGSESEPWLRLLCYDAAKAVRLADIARGPALEPHPVSGEVEVDWAHDAETRYRRLDQETLQALVALPELGIAFQLVYCVHDKEGGDGWRIGEVTVAEQPLPFSQFGGALTIAEAERRYRDREASGRTNGGQEQQQVGDDGGGNQECKTDNTNTNDDDDDYWDLYDKTPVRTPAAERSPAPRSTTVLRSESPQPQADPSSSSSSAAAEDAYFAQYANVQPAMDNHDPDEQAHAEQVLNLPASMPTSQPHPNLSPESNSTSESQSAPTPLRQPHPDSPTSSPTPNTIARLEHLAGQQTRNEFGVKQHISRSIRSLYMLATASGMPADDFHSLVKTELECLSMMDEGDGLGAATNGMGG